MVLIQEIRSVWTKASRGGAPAGYGRPGVNLREELIVEPGTWARVKYNGRFSGDEW